MLPKKSKGYRRFRYTIVLDIPKHLASDKLHDVLAEKWLDAINAIGNRQICIVVGETNDIAFVTDMDMVN